MSELLAENQLLFSELPTPGEPAAAELPFRLPPTIALANWAGIRPGPAPHDRLTVSDGSVALPATAVFEWVGTRMTPRRSMADIITEPEASLAAEPTEATLEDSVAASDSQPDRKERRSLFTPRKVVAGLALAACCIGAKGNNSGCANAQDGTSGSGKGSQSGSGSGCSWMPDSRHYVRHTSPKIAQQVAKSMLAHCDAIGGSAAWGDMKWLINKESSWLADEWGPPTTHGRAYGLPQALPASKMTNQRYYDGSVEAQIRWFFWYIQKNPHPHYGTIANARAHEESHNWY